MPKATKKAPEIEILEALLALRTTIDRKCKRLKLTSTWSDRGIPCVRSTASGAHAYLEIFEGGYRGSLWPRVVYVLDGRHFGNGIANTVRAARKAELAEPNKMVARRDLRGCAVVEPDVNGTHDRDPMRDLYLGDFLDAHGNSRVPESGTRRIERAQIRVNNAQAQLDRETETLRRLGGAMTQAAVLATIPVLSDVERDPPQFFDGVHVVHVRRDDGINGWSVSITFGSIEKQDRAQVSCVGALLPDALDDAVRTVTRLGVLPGKVTLTAGSVSGRAAIDCVQAEAQRRGWHYRVSGYL